MNVDFSNKVVVITGGASGIGLATAKMISNDHATVVIVDRNATGKVVAESLGPDAIFVECDVSKHAEVKKSFSLVGEKFGRVDVLVNNAGIQTYGNVVDMPEEEWDYTFDVNIKSMFLCSKYAIPLMMQTASPVIVNVASVKSFVCQVNEAAYVASKTAVIGLTRSIAADFAPKLRCVAVCPGAVRTPLLENELDKVPSPLKEQLISQTQNIHLVGRIAEPEEVAGFIIFLASEHATFATGQAFRVDGGIGIRIEGT